MPSDRIVIQRPSYFLAPPRASVPHSPIRLGAIIPSPSLPDEPLYIPPTLPSSPAPSPFTETDWRGTHVRKSSARLGVWTSFLQHVVGIGVDASFHASSTLHQRWNVDEMHTLSFVPTQAFLEDCVRSEEVRGYIATNRFREKVYVITGIMVAEGCTWVRARVREKGISVHVGVDAMAWSGVPVAGGPEGRWEGRNSGWK